MDYELCKKLKDAEFPFRNDVFDEGNRIIWKDDEDTGDCPSLSELIEACGDRFKGILRNLFEGNIGDKWIASDMEERFFGTGDTLEEAVAKLWLALNKK